MAHITDNLLLQESSSSGAGDFSLDSAVPQYQTIASKVSVGDTLHYRIAEVDAAGRPNGDWEIGRGTIGTGPVLQRTTVIASSTGAKVSFSAGTTKHVSLTVLAPTTTQLKTDWRGALGLDKLPNMTLAEILTDVNLTGSPAAPNATAGTRGTRVATMQSFTDEFELSTAINGYQVLPSGLIIQWGAVTSPGTGGVTVTFPIAFPNACLRVLGSNATTSTAGLTVFAGNQTKTTVSIASSSGSVVIVWFAIGY